MNEMKRLLMLATCSSLLAAVTGIAFATENDGAPTESVDLLISEATQVTGVPDAVDRYHQFREPCLVVTERGRLVMVAQGRDQSGWSDRSGQDLVVTYSDDDGRTWSKPALVVEHGNRSICPQALVYDRNQDALHLLYNLFLWDYRGGKRAWKDHDGPQCRQYQLVSHDGGESWSEPREITKFFGDAGPIVVFGSGRGIQLEHGEHAGRLIVPGSNRHGAWTNAAVFSDDHSKTWHEGGSAGRKVPRAKLNIRGECKIAELRGVDGKGTLVMNARCSPLRVQAASTDGGNSFGRFEVLGDMPAASCNGSLIGATLKDDREVLLACVPVGVTGVSRNAWTAEQARSRGMVYVSFDGGKTWPHRRTVVNGSFAYSSMTQMNDGDIGLAYETELHVQGSYKHIRFTRFSLDWLLAACDSMPDRGAGL